LFSGFGSSFNADNKTAEKRRKIPGALLNFNGHFDYCFQEKIRMRTDHFLHNLTTRVSRAFWYKALEKGFIFINYKPMTKKSYLLKTGDVIQFDYYHLCRILLGEDLNFSTKYQILKETSDYLAVNKPSGVLIHRVGFVDHSLISQLENDYQQPLFSVHRIDKFTSGICLIARSSKAADALQALIRNNQINKIYLVATEKKLPQKSGLFTAPIGHDDPAIHTKKQKIDFLEGAECKTRFRLIGQKENYYYLVRIFTGRQHQIRVHFQFGGAPVANDELYSHDDYSIFPPMYDYSEYELGLHAFHLCFKCPFSDKLTHIKCLPRRKPFCTEPLPLIEK
jgi:RluA family pseudouridine synthase